MASAIVTPARDRQPRQPAPENLDAEQTRDWIHVGGSEFWDSYIGSRAELIRAQLVAPDFQFPGDGGAEALPLGLVWNLR